MSTDHQTAAERPQLPPPRPMPPVPERGQGVPSCDEIRYLIAHAEAAPSGGNFQPWRFVSRGAVLDCRIVPEVGDYFANFRSNELYISLGAAVANIEAAAARIGLVVQMETFPVAGDPELACRLEMRRGDPELWLARLAEEIPYRLSARKAGQRRPLSAEHGEALERVAANAGCALRLVSDGAALDRLGSVLATLNHMAYLNRESHQGIMKILRWSRQEARATGDGILLSTFELSAFEQMAFAMLRSWPVVYALDRLGVGAAIRKAALEWATSSSAMALLSAPGRHPLPFLIAGRALERIWLEVTQSSYGLHILGVLSLLDRLEHAGEGLSEAECRTLERQRSELRQVLPVPEGHTAAVLLRAVPANPNVERTFRRGTDGIVSFEDAS